MNTNKFPSFNFKRRLSSMIKVDLRRLFTSSFYYIMIGISLVIPILILVMTTMMAGTESVDPVTGEVSIMEQMFTSVWQAIGTIPGQSSEMAMDVTTMCNIDMMFFAVAVLVCLFVSGDFNSGFSKSLFTTRSDKIDYVASKTLTCFIGGASLILAYFIGALLGGAISGLSFELVNITEFNIVMCILSKILLVLVFVPIFLTMSVIGKQKTWFSMILSFSVGMLLFMMVSMITPLNATMLNVILCTAGGVMFSFGLGAVSNNILKKSSLL